MRSARHWSASFACAMRLPGSSARAPPRGAGGRPSAARSSRSLPPQSLTLPSASIAASAASAFRNITCAELLHRFPSRCLWTRTSLGTRTPFALQASWRPAMMSCGVLGAPIFHPTKSVRVAPRSTSGPSRSWRVSFSSMELEMSRATNVACSKDPRCSAAAALSDISRTFSPPETSVSSWCRARGNSAPSTRPRMRQRRAAHSSAVLPALTPHRANSALSTSRPSTASASTLSNAADFNPSGANAGASSRWGRVQSCFGLVRLSTRCSRGRAAANRALCARLVSTALAGPRARASFEAHSLRLRLFDSPVSGKKTFLSKVSSPSFFP